MNRIKEIHQIYPNESFSGIWNYWQNPIRAKLDKVEQSRTKLGMPRHDSFFHGDLSTC